MGDFTFKGGLLKMVLEEAREGKTPSNFTRALLELVLMFTKLQEENQILAKEIVSLKLSCAIHDKVDKLNEVRDEEIEGLNNHVQLLTILVMKLLEKSGMKLEEILRFPEAFPSKKIPTPATPKEPTPKETTTTPKEVTKEAVKETPEKTSDSKEETFSRSNDITLQELLEQCDFCREAPVDRDPNCVCKNCNRFPYCKECSLTMSSSTISSSYRCLDCLKKRWQECACSGSTARSVCSNKKCGRRGCAKCFLFKDFTLSEEEGAVTWYCPDCWKTT